MAFANLTEENQIKPGQLDTGEGPVAAGGQGAAGVSKAAATPGQNVPQQPSAQLSAYLNANKPQAEAFAGDIANNLSGQVSAAQGAINPAVNAYTSNLYSVPTNAEANQAVEASPSGLTEDQKAAYKAQLGASSKSPNSANTFETTSPYQDLTSNIENTVNQLDVWNGGNNIPAISSALAPFEKQGQNSGTTKLDALLLSQNPGAYKKIQGAIAPAKGLQGNLAAGAKTANTALQNAISQNSAATKAANASAGKFVGNLNTQLADYLAKAQGDAAIYNSGLNDLSGSVANAQPQYNTLKQAVDNWNNEFKGPNSKAEFPSAAVGDIAPLPSTMGMPNVQQVATQKNYSDIAALQELLGLSGVSALNPSITSDTASMSGGYQIPGASDLGDIYGPALSPTKDFLTTMRNIFSDPTNPLVSTSMYGPYAGILDAYNALAGTAGIPGITGPQPGPHETPVVYQQPNGTFSSDPAGQIPVAPPAQSTPVVMPGGSEGNGKYRPIEEEVASQPPASTPIVMPGGTAGKGKYRPV